LQSEEAKEGGTHSQERFPSRCREGEFTCLFFWIILNLDLIGFGYRFGSSRAVQHVDLPILLAISLFTCTCSFFAGCHLFIPLFDPSYDTYESLMERSPWTFDAILAVAGKIRSGNGPLSPTFYKCLEEAQGIARSSLFGPVVRKEAVQGD